MELLKKLTLVMALSAAASFVSASDVYDFNKGWMFQRLDKQADFVTVRQNHNQMSNAKSNTADYSYPFVAARLDERNYRQVDLPHDWAVEDGFYREENSEHGFRRRGWGYYRKHFFIPESWRGKHIEIEFGGIASYSNLWFNNTPFHHNFSGYNTMTLDLTPMAMYNAENLIVVEVNADISEGWWYEGAGIYRDVKIIVSEPCHIVTDGILVRPELINGKWSVSAEVEVGNYGRTTEDISVEYWVESPDGTKTAPAVMGSVKPVPLETMTVSAKFEPGSVELWSPDSPKLYKFVAVTKVNGKETDRKTVNFGYRTFKWDAATGFYLNGQPLKLNGTCNHQDHAGVGVAVPASIEEFRIQLLKKLGTNAYRCSHNPPSRNILDLCDKYGLLVIDENRNLNASPLWLANAEWLVKRDRNHPCVIAWSLFNEEPLMGSERGENIARYLGDVFKKYDPTRPVIGAMNGGFYDKYSVRNVLDIVGLNYQYGTIDPFHSRYPNIPMVLTEGASAFETRGEYTTDRNRLTCTSYDEYGASWGSTHRVDWKAVMTRPYVAGSFIWTGFDYHGEPTPYNNKFPANSSYFGIMDLCGFPKAAFYLRQAMWLKTPVVSIIPHWTWPGREGQDIKVFCASNAQEVTFELNGKTVGTFPVDKYEMLTANIKYEPGKLVAIAKNDGKEVARTEVATAGKAVSLKLEPYWNELANDGDAATPVKISAVDENGNVVPDAARQVEITVEGSGRNIGVGNGDPTSTEPEKGNTRKLFHGLAMVIVQSDTGAEAPIRITVKAEGLKDATCEIAMKKVEAPLRVNAYKRR